MTDRPDDRKLLMRALLARWRDASRHWREASPDSSDRAAWFAEMTALRQEYVTASSTPDTLGTSSRRRQRP
jgi:hypothetical protein